MKNNLRRLKALSKIISLEMFYNIEVNTIDIKLQAHYESDLCKVLVNYKFLPSISPYTGYVIFNRKNIIITLSN